MLNHLWACLSPKIKLIKGKCVFKLLVKPFLVGQLGTWKDSWERGSGQSGSVLRLQGSGPAGVWHYALGWI